MGYESGFNPEGHTAFKNPFTKEKEAQQREREAIPMHEILYALRKQAENNEPLPPKVGNALGRRIVQGFAGIHQSKSLSREQRSAEIKKMHRHYKEVFGPEYESRMQGFMAEFAVGYSIQEDVGYPVYYPTPEEDHQGKVDLWVDLENGKKLAIQVKCTRIEGNRPDILYNLDSPDDEHQLLSLLQGSVKSYDKLKDDINTMMEYFADQPDIIPVFAVLPTPESDNGRYNAESGLPQKDLGTQLYGEIEEKFLDEV